MKVTHIVAGAVVAMSLFGGAAAQAQDCSAATYYEDYPTNTYSYGRTDFWEVPDLANGQSITLGNGYQEYYLVTGYGYQWTYYAPEDLNHSQTWLTFTCQNGTITGGASWGYWA